MPEILHLAFLLSAACGTSGRLPSSGSSAPPRWIHRTWSGPAVINQGPVVTLCSDGRYWTTAVFEAPQETSGYSVDRGVACCQLWERGTYELDRDAHGEPVGVRFTPTFHRDGQIRPPYGEALGGGMLGGFREHPRPMPCDDP